MNTLGDGASNRRDESLDQSLDQSVERILGKATPRPVPSAEETRIVRENIRGEWLAVANKHKRHRRLVSFSIAASILVVIFAGFNTIRTSGMSETQVAVISKSFGSIYILGENSELLERTNVYAVMAGQTIITDEASGIGFAWGQGGSLRLDEHSRVEFISRDSIYLRSGRVYFDSRPQMLQGPTTTAKLTITTDHGEVTHVGTQYMTQADAMSLTISVREGEVRIESQSAVETASAGQQLQVRGGAPASIANIKPYGDNWRWIEQTAPVAVLDGRSLHDFLGWVSHETGMTVQFASDDIEADTKKDLLRGTVDTDATSALRIWMLGNDLQWKIEDGVIFIDDEVTGNGQNSEIQN